MDHGRMRQRHNRSRRHRTNSSSTGILASQTSSFLRNETVFTHFRLEYFLRQTTGRRSRQRSRTTSRRQRTPTPFTRLVKTRPIIRAGTGRANGRRHHLLTNKLPASRRAFTPQHKGLHRMRQGATRFSTHQRTLRRAPRRCRRQHNRTRHHMAKRTNGRRNTNNRRYRNSSRAFTTTIAISMNTRRGHTRQARRRPNARNHRKRRRKYGYTINERRNLNGNHNMRTMSRGIRRLGRIATSGTGSHFTFTHFTKRLGTLALTILLGSLILAPPSYQARTHEHLPGDFMAVYM